MEQESINSPPYTLFYSYSHEDEELRDLLDKQLIMLRRSGLIREWHDRKILPGDQWDKEISKYLDAARIVLLLISSDFLASQYCYDIEANRALERYEKGEVCLIPIILRPVVWQLTPFSKIQALPKNALPVEQWDDLDLAFVNVCEGILAVIMSLKSGNKIVPPAAVSLPPAQPRALAAQTYSRKRVLDAALPDRVAVEKTIALVTMIRRQDSEGLRKILKVNEERYGVSSEDVYSTDSFPLEFPLDSEGEPQPLDLAIKIESPDFEPKTQTKDIRILPRGDTEPRIFLLTPKREGDLFVNVELYKDNRLVTGCLLETNSSQTKSETQTVNLASVALNSSQARIPASPQARVKIQEQLDELSVDEDFRTLDDLRSKIKTTIAEADLGKELSESSLDARLDKLQDQTGDVQAREKLEELKAKEAAAPSVNYPGEVSQNYGDEMILPLSPQPQPSYSPDPKIFGVPTSDAGVTYSSAEPKKKSPLFGIASALLIIIFPVAIGFIIFSSNPDVAVNVNSSLSNVIHTNHNSNTPDTEYNSYVFHADYAKVSRADYERDRTKYEMQKGNSVIGQGANDSWIWFKTKSALATGKDLRGSMIDVDVSDDVITLRGTVATAAQKKAAETAARRIEGQKGVKNELKIQAGNSTGNQAVGDNSNTRKPNTKANMKKRVVKN